jgi:hypothetical protein
MPIPIIGAPVSSTGQQWRLRHAPSASYTRKQAQEFRPAIWLTLAILPLFIVFVLFWVAPKIALLQAHERAAVSRGAQ